MKKIGYCKYHHKYVDLNHMEVHKCLCKNVDKEPCKYFVKNNSSPYWIDIENRNVHIKNYINKPGKRGISWKGYSP
jgi:hypothetical protein